MRRILGQELCLRLLQAELSKHPEEKYRSCVPYATSYEVFVSRRSFLPLKQPDYLSLPGLMAFRVSYS